MAYFVSTMFSGAWERWAQLVVATPLGSLLSLDWPSSLRSPRRPCR